MLPTFLGIGAPKAATTWLSLCLDEHPDVYVAPVKETDFFRRFTVDQIDAYEAHFDGATDESAIGEITTIYLNVPHVAPRVHEALPDARLFVSLRNPMDQVYSYFWHLERQNMHDRSRPNPDTFEAALDQYADLLLGPAHYGQHIDRWLQYYDRSQLHILLYDDVKSDPAGTLASLYAFLGVDPSFRPASLRNDGASARRGTSPRSPLWNRVYLGLYDALVNYVYGPIKRAAGERAAARLKDTLRVRQVMESIFRQPGYPDMRPDTRERLREHFAPEIRRVEALTGRDLSHWT